MVSKPVTVIISPAAYPGWRLTVTYQYYRNREDGKLKKKYRGTPVLSIGVELVRPDQPVNQIHERRAWHKICRSIGRRMVETEYMWNKTCHAGMDQAYKNAVFHMRHVVAEQCWEIGHPARRAWISREWEAEKLWFHARVPDFYWISVAARMVPALPRNRDVPVVAQRRDQEETKDEEPSRMEVPAVARLRGGGITDNSSDGSAESKKRDASPSSNPTHAGFFMRSHEEPRTLNGQGRSKRHKSQLEEGKAEEPSTTEGEPFEGASSA
jgi:hypothetical protein